MNFQAQFIHQEYSAVWLGKFIEVVFSLILQQKQTLIAVVSNAGTMPKKQYRTYVVIVNAVGMKTRTHVLLIVQPKSF